MINPVPSFISTFFQRGGQTAPGSAPGIEKFGDTRPPERSDSFEINVIDICEAQYQQSAYADIDSMLAAPTPDWSTTRWIDIVGLHPYLLKRLKESYPIHTLAAEDALNNHQRPKVEDYEDTLFIILRMLRVVDSQLRNEQVSFFFVGNTIITIQEEKGDVWDNVRKRIAKPGARIRTIGAPYLLYALIDAVVDHISPLLDLYFQRIDELEVEIINQPRKDAQSRIHRIKRELSYLRQSIAHTRDVITFLLRDEEEFLPESTEPYFRDVFDHSVHALEAIEIFRENANGLQDLLMASASNKMNEVMKALTIMASLFLPITFFAGVYGMNFDYIPELGWKYAYPTFWGICIASTAGLLVYFKRKGWL